MEIEESDQSGVNQVERNVRMGKQALGGVVGPDTQGRKEGFVQNKPNFRQAEVNVNLFA